MVARIDGVLDPGSKDVGEALVHGSCFACVAEVCLASHDGVGELMGEEIEGDPRRQGVAVRLRDERIGRGRPVAEVAHLDRFGDPFPPITDR